MMGPVVRCRCPEKCVFHPMPEILPNEDFIALAEKSVLVITDICTGRGYWTLEARDIVAELILSIEQAKRLKPELQKTEFIFERDL